MGKGRLEAFTDGVLAVVITIMVLELKVPAGHDFAALRSEPPVFLAYALSYANVGIFWNNHHMLHVTERINGMVLWANLFLLFWISLVPFAIRWMDETHFTSAPTALYGGILAMASIAYILLERAIIVCNGPTSKLARAREGVPALASGRANRAQLPRAIPKCEQKPHVRSDRHLPAVNSTGSLP